jgi:hypothetical protein
MRNFYLSANASASRTECAVDDQETDGPGRSRRANEDGQASAPLSKRLITGLPVEEYRATDRLMNEIHLDAEPQNSISQQRPVFGGKAGFDSFSDT